MATFLISVTAFMAAGLTLFSGFGLGTILTPIVVIFFPVPVAIAITAVVHLLNNLFKLGLLWRQINKSVLLAFGIPALLAAIPGAFLLDYLAVLPALMEYQWLGASYSITPVKLVAGILLIVFATAEIVPFLNRLSKSHAGLPIGGLLSGFFGGLSGNQGAFRSAFLIKAGLTKASFVATSAAIAALVDVSRIIVYGFTFDLILIENQLTLVLLATISAFLGVFMASRLLHKVTIGFIQKLVAVMLYTLGGLLGAGII